MNALTRLRARVRESWRRHQRKQKLRRELADYRTPAERAELEAILARYDTTVEELVRSLDRDDEAADAAAAAAGGEQIPTLDLALIPTQRHR